MRNAITESKANGYTIAAIMREHGLTEAQVTAHLAAAAAGFNSSRDKADFDAEKASRSETPSKPSEGASKVIPHVRRKDRLGAHTDPSPGTCAVCGQPILPTGKRGRPRIIHIECRKA